MIAACDGTGLHPAVMMGMISRETNGGVGWGMFVKEGTLGRDGAPCSGTQCCIGESGDCTVDNSDIDVAFAAVTGWGDINCADRGGCAFGALQIDSSVDTYWTGQAVDLPKNIDLVGTPTSSVFTDPFDQVYLNYVAQILDMSMRSLGSATFVNARCAIAGWNREVALDECSDPDHDTENNTYSKDAVSRAQYFYNSLTWDF